MVNEIVQQIFVPNLSENSDFILNTVCNRLYDIISGNINNDVEYYDDISGTHITIVYKISPIKKYLKSKRVLLSHLKSYTKIKNYDKLYPQLFKRRTFSAVIRSRFNHLLFLMKI